MLVLTPEEEQVILEYRKNQKYYKDRKYKQETCEHEWRWACAMHNDDAYDCVKCGATKFE